MAVSTENAHSGPFLTNGSTTVFPFSFTAPTDAEVSVVLVTDAARAIVSPSLYIVSRGPSAGGSVTFYTAPAAGELFILLNPDFTQDITFENGSAWLAEPVNEAYDRSALRDQALKRDVDRAAKVEVGAEAPTIGTIAEGDVLGKVDGIVRGVPNTPVAAESAAVRAENARRDTLAAEVRTRASELEAEAARDGAIIAKNAAGSYAADAGMQADAAALAGPLYANEAAGRAAVANGVEFRARGATDKRAIDIWRRDSASSSTLLQSYPSLNAILRSRVDAVPMVFANKVMFADGEGGIGPEMLTPTSPTITDIYARLAAAGNDTFRRVSWLTNIIAAWFYGQSNAIGTSGPAGQPITTTPVRGGLRFNAGVRPMDAGEDPAAWGPLVDLRETKNANMAETMASGFVQRINERLTRDLGRDLVDKGQSVLCMSVGEGGATWAQLSNPSVPWTRLTNSLAKAIDPATLGERTIQPGVMVWNQGEASQVNTAAQYYAGVKALWDGFEAECRAQTGVDRPLMFCVMQTGNAPALGWNGSRICDGQMWLAERNTYGLFCGPTYFVDFADSQHYAPTGHKTLGAYAADAVYDFVFGEVKHVPLRPVVARVASNILKLTYPVRTGARLVIDDRLSTQLGVTQKQHGLRIAARADENVESPASEIEFAVALTGINEITLTAAVDIPEGETHQLRQVWHGAGTQRVLSEIRDTAGDLLPLFDPAGLNVRMNNWLPTCSELIP